MKKQNVFKQAIPIFLMLVMIILMIPFSTLPTAATVWDGSVAAGFARGSGTKSDPYVIETAEQLVFLAQSVNGGTTYADQYIKLGADIVLNDTSDEGWTATATLWTPIGTSSSNAFQGKFDGEGHVIKGICTDASSSYQGLFGYIDGEALVTNVGVVDSFISGSTYVGAIAGYSRSGAITNCYNTGDVSGTSNIGGIVGGNFDAAIASCYNQSTVSGTSYVGGIAGASNRGYTSDLTYVDNCYNTGIVRGDANIGGIVGGYGAARSCYNTGSVSGTSNVGGIVGNGFALCCYYLDSCVSGGNAKGTPLSDEQMQDASSFTGFDFLNFWETSDDYQYPRLMGFNGISIEDSSVWDGTVAAGFASGTGTQNDPYMIKTASQLAFFAQSVNDGTTYTGQYIKLGADIVLNDTSKKQWIATATPWTPIGTSSNSFQGNFDGNDHTIKGIYINGGSSDYHQGFFGYAYNAAIANLGIADSYIKSGRYVGGIVGTYDGNTLTNCYNIGTIIGYDYVGGIVGYNKNTVENCHNEGIVFGKSYVGGIVGDNRANVIDCYNMATVSGSSAVAGIAGNNKANVTDCYNTGDVGGESSVGGVAGNNEANITNCYNLGDIRGSSSVGGVVGYNYPIKNDVTVSDCYNKGAVSGSGNDVGGVVGHNYVYNTQYKATVQNCYNDGRISGVSYVAGVVGDNEIGANSYSSNYKPKSIIKNCHNTGTISGTGNYVGGVVGSNFLAPRNCYTADMTLENCYNTGDVNGTNYVGGVIGRSSFSISDGSSYCNYSLTVNECCNIGSVRGNKYVGGVVGYHSAYNSNANGNSCTGDAVVSDCYNEGIVTGNEYVGGVAGYNKSYNMSYYNINSYYSAAILSRCYNAGTVSGTNYVGGVAGHNYAEDLNNGYNGTFNFYSAQIVNCYYLDTCVTEGNNYGSACSDEQMKLLSTFSGFSDTVWEVGSLCGYNYPTLKEVFIAEKDHTYSNLCDTTCNACEHIRTTTHIRNPEDRECKTSECMNCGIEMPAIAEHTWNDGVVTTDPTCTTGGVKTFTCECGETYTEAVSTLDHDYTAQGNCSVCGEYRATFSGASLTLEDNIAVNFKVAPEQFEGTGYTNPYVVFSFNGEQYTVTEYTFDTKGRYAFAFTDIAPRMMNDVIVATLYATYEGEQVVCQSRSYSVKEYCYNMLARCGAGGVYENNEKFKALLVDLLNYGEAAQLYGDYNVDTLVTADLTDTQKSWATEATPAVSTVQNLRYKTIKDPSVAWKAGGLLLEDAVTMRFKFSVDSIEGVTVKFYTDSNPTGWTVSADELVETTGGYYVYFDGLKARQMRETVYVAVYRGDTVISNTVSYSIESYAYAKKNDSNANLTALLEAMMKYGDSAYKYING